MIPNTFTKLCQGLDVGWFSNNTILWYFTIGLRPAASLYLRVLITLEKLQLGIELETSTNYFSALMYPTFMYKIKMMPQKNSD